MIKLLKSDEVFILKKLYKLNMYPIQRDSLERDLATGKKTILVYVEDSFVIGAVTLTKNDDKLHLSDLVVDEKYRRKGIGTSLVRESINYAEENNFDEITLNVREENDAAINLYDNEEFMVKGVFQDREGKYFKMSKNLQNKKIR